MKVSLIAAVAKNNVIGNKGKIPWHISEDFRHFKELTMGHVIVMGQRTFLSIGRPLPGRTNIVLTMDKSFKPDGCTTVHSPDEAIKKANELGEKEVFIIGGGMVYKTFFPLADRVYLTKIAKDYEGDTFFPDIKPSEWINRSVEKKHSDEGNIDYEFIVLERK